MNYATYTVVQLKEIAKSRGLKGYSKLRKDDLIKLIESSETTPKTTKKKQTKENKPAKKINSLVKLTKKAVIVTTRQQLDKVLKNL